MGSWIFKYHSPLKETGTSLRTGNGWFQSWHSTKWEQGGVFRAHEDLPEGRGAVLIGSYSLDLEQLDTNLNNNINGVGPAHSRSL